MQQVKVLDIRPLAVTTSESLVFNTPASTRKGWYAKVEVPAGHTTDTLHLSRYDDEPLWVVDGRFRGSFPVFHNGVGSRAVRLEYATHYLQAVLDAEITAREVLA